MSLPFLSVDASGVAAGSKPASVTAPDGTRNVSRIDGFTRSTLGQGDLVTQVRVWAPQVQRLRIAVDGDQCKT